MFTKLGRFVVQNPWKVIAAWVIAAIAVVAFAPTLSDVTNKDQASFLPDSYESVQAQKLAADAFGQTNDATASIVVKRSDGGALTAADQAKVTDLASKITAAKIERVTGAVTGPQAVSPNKQVQLVSVGLKGLAEDQAVLDAVQKVRDVTGPAMADSGLQYGVTGDVALFLDNQDAFENAFIVVGIATLVLIVGLLLFIYRSPVAALLPILTVGLVSAIAPGLIALAAKAFDLQVTQDLQTILTVVLYGVGTDYILFLLFRFRERLRAGEQPKEALISATARVSEVIVSAAGAIVVAFSALLLAVFGGFKSLGPGLAIAVAVMAFAAITLIPAVVSLLGPKVFWPSKSWQKTPKGATFKRLGRFTARRPGVVALVSGGLMVLLALGTLGMKVDYDAFSQLPKDTESGRAIKDLQAGFPAGALSPTTVYVKSTDGTPLNPTEAPDVRRQAGQRPGCRFGSPRRGRRLAGTAQPGQDSCPDQRGAGRRAVRENLSGSHRRRAERRRPRPGPGRYDDADRRGQRELRRHPGRQQPRSQGDLPGRGRPDRDHPRALAAQSAGSADADARGRAQLLQHHRRDRAGLPGRGRARGRDVLAADHALPVRRCHRHRLQHPDDRAAA